MANISTLQAFYKDYLHTDEGRKHLGIGLKLQKDWNTYKADFIKHEGITSMVCTAYVDADTLLKRHPNAQKVPITPIGMNNLCFANSELFTECGFKSVLGYSVLSCNCKKRFTYELHSVNKDDTGKYYDFTRDFNKEEYKWFVPFEDVSYSAGQFLSIWGDDNNVIIIDTECTCPTYKRVKVQRGTCFMTIKNICDFIDNVNNIPVYIR